MTLKRVFVGMFFNNGAPQEIYMDFIEYSLYYKLVRDSNFWIYLVVIFFLSGGLFMAKHKYEIIIFTANLTFHLMFLIKQIKTINYNRKNPSHSEKSEAFTIQVNKILSNLNPDL
jgi:hypothetical protein